MWIQISSRLTENGKESGISCLGSHFEVLCYRRNKSTKLLLCSHKYSNLHSPFTPLLVLHQIQLSVSRELGGGVAKCYLSVLIATTTSVITSRLEHVCYTWHFSHDHVSSAMAIAPPSSPLNALTKSPPSRCCGCCFCARCCRYIRSAYLLRLRL